MTPEEQAIVDAVTAKLSFRPGQRVRHKIGGDVGTIEGHGTRPGTWRVKWSAIVVPQEWEATKIEPYEP